VVIVNTRGKRIDYLGRTYPGKTHDKKIADEEGISYPPGATLYKDTGFQGYEPTVKKTCQAKKKSHPEASLPRLRSEPTGSWHRFGSRWNMISQG